MRLSWPTEKAYQYQAKAKISEMPTLKDRADVEDRHVCSGLIKPCLRTNIGTCVLV